MSDKHVPLTWLARGERGWYAWCECGWRTEETTYHNADAMAAEHNARHLRGK